MAGVSSTNFAVLMNGMATHFFKGQRGIRQGCPLSPFLFLIIADDLSRLLRKVEDFREIGGINLDGLLKVLIILFVDDVVVSGKGSIKEWEKIWDLINLLCRDTGMSVNMRKSFFIYNQIKEEDMEILKSMFPMEFRPLNVGFKYLGYKLNPNNYRKVDWL